MAWCEQCAVTITNEGFRLGAQFMSTIDCKCDQCGSHLRSAKTQNYHSLLVCTHCMPDHNLRCLRDLCKSKVFDDCILQAQLHIFPKVLQIAPLRTISKRLLLINHKPLNVNIPNATKSLSTSRELINLLERLNEQQNLSVMDAFPESFAVARSLWLHQNIIYCNWSL